MKKGYIIAILVVAAIVVAAIIWGARDNQENDSSSTTTSSQQTENTAEENSDTEEALVVEYDGSGFTPETLTVQQGDTVTFVNRSSTLVWPASDDHPVHDDLSGFDALEGLGEGEEYSFTFNEVGEWGYHNHLNSSQTGTIIVE